MSVCLSSSCGRFRRSAEGGTQNLAMDMVEFPEPNEFVQNVLNFLFDWLIQADRATRHLGEEDVKGAIAVQNTAWRA